MRIVPHCLHTTLQRISSRSREPQTTHTSGMPIGGGSSSGGGSFSGSVLLKIEREIHRRR